MLVKLNGVDTQVVLSDAPWTRGIQRMTVGEHEIPFLLPALCAHHFFTGAWPPPPDAIDYEPHESPGSLAQLSGTRACWHQPETPYTHVETRIEYEIVARGTVEARFETCSHATSYPWGYVGLFWGTIAAPGGQRGIHLLLPTGQDKVRWSYFQGGGDSQSPRANTVLGPEMPSATHAPGHPPTYYFAESEYRFALPIQVARWRDLYYSVEADSDDIAFTDVLLGTAVGGPSWDLYWRLRPGESRRICCRLTVGPWPGWEEIEQRYRAWPGCIAPTFATERTSHGVRQPFDRPDPVQIAPRSGLALSRRLFETRGKDLLAELNLLDRCSVGCIGGTSQNASLDDAVSRDHNWGPYLSFLLSEDDWEAHHEQLEQAVQEMPDEVDGVRWRGGAAGVRKTEVCEIGAFLRDLTGFDTRPETDREWLPHIGRTGFGGRRWTEQLFDAGQGEVFHDPGKHYRERWRHWVAYVPPDIHRALLARSLWRVWNVGPNYNLERAQTRADRLTFDLCLSRFVEEVLELAFCWNESFVPFFKWRAAHFYRLPICPAPVRKGIERLSESAGMEAEIEIASTIVTSIKRLVKDLYHLDTGLEAPLFVFSHAMRETIEDPEIRDQI